MRLRLTSAGLIVMAACGRLNAGGGTEAGAAAATTQLQALATAESTYFAKRLLFDSALTMADSAGVRTWIVRADSLTFHAVATHQRSGAVCWLQLTATPCQGAAAPTITCAPPLD
jgi:hypothetical protein